MKHKVRSLLLKLETTYGVDSVPTAALNAMLVRDLKVSPVSVAYDTRSNVKAFAGSDQQIVANFHAMVEFSCEMTLSGSPGVAPPWSAALRASAHSETIVATTSVTYAQVSDAEESATIYYRQKNDLFKIVGCRGAATKEFAKGKAPLLKFKFEGLVTQLGAISTLAPTAASYALWQKPLAVNKDNTTFTIGGYAAILESLTVDSGQKNTYVNRPNSERVDATNHEAVGKLLIEKPELATKEFYTDIKAANLMALSLTHGTVAGNKITFSSAQCQLTSPDDTDSDDITMLDLSLVFVPSAAGNDYTILLN